MGQAAPGVQDRAREAESRGDPRWARGDAPLEIFLDALVRSHDAVEHGLPVRYMLGLVTSAGLSNQELAQISGMSPATIARQRKKGADSSLPVVASDRLARFGRVLAAVTRYFEDRDAARAWMRRPAPALGNETPLQRATTDSGARDVLRLIGRLEHGIAV